MPSCRPRPQLARSAGRAQARGALAAAAAYLQGAATLTPDPSRRARRLLDAARAKRDAGALDAALDLLAAADAGPPDELRTAEAQHLRGQITLEQRRGHEAARLLIGAARRLEPLDVGLARETYLQALGAAIWAGESEQPGILREVAAAARAAPTGPEPLRASDVLLDAFAIRLMEGHTAAAPTLARALKRILALDAGTDIDVGRWLRLAGMRAGGIIAGELWDDDARHTLAVRQVEVARSAGALVQSQYALNFLAWIRIDAGELAMAARLLDEDRLIAEATGTSPVGFCAILLAAWRGEERVAVELAEATTRLAAAGRMSRLLTVADHASAVLYKGLGPHDADYAILLILLRLGLRAGEVAGLRLDDIDWRAGEVVVRGKGRHEDRLPLPSDVGEAIVAYLRRGRPKTTGHREVFLRAVAPLGPLGTNGISGIVRAACLRAGVPVVGAHRLRHTVACQMADAGVPLPEIARALRHRSISSTAEYARVDIERLRTVAQPWPGGGGR